MNTKNSWLRNKILSNIYKIGGKLNRIEKNFNEITINELQLLRNSGLLIDVRSPQEYDEGHIDGAINIPSYDLEKKIYNYTDNKEKIIILYCQSGYRGQKAANTLNNIGFKNVYNLKGGLDAI